MPEVRVLGGLRRHTGGPSFHVEAVTVRDALDATAARGGEALSALLFGQPGEDMHPDLRVLVNGRSIVFLEGVDTPLAESDTVTVHFAGARGYPGG